MTDLYGEEAGDLSALTLGNAIEFILSEATASSDYVVDAFVQVAVPGEELTGKEWDAAYAKAEEVLEEALAFIRKALEAFDSTQKWTGTCPTCGTSSPWEELNEGYEEPHQTGRIRKS